MSYQDGYILEGLVQDNYLHGFARIYDDFGTKELRKFGFYCMGKRQGIWWTLIEGGGSIIESETETAYLYPDFKTALLGEFQATTLVRAQATSLAQVVKEENDNFLIPLFHEPTGPEYKRDVSSLEYMTSQPLLRARAKRATFTKKKVFRSKTLLFKLFFFRELQNEKGSIK